MGRSDKLGMAAAGTTEVLKALTGLPVALSSPSLAASSAWMAFANWGKSCGVKGTETETEGEAVQLRGKQRGLVLEEEEGEEVEEMAAVLVVIGKW